MDVFVFIVFVGFSYPHLWGRIDVKGQKRGEMEWVEHS